MAKQSWAYIGIAAGALALTAACSAGSDDISEFGEDPIAADPGDDGEQGDDEEPPFEGGEGAGGDAKGCEKVDFLFVIDNSISMLNEQTALVASFPGFMAAIEATLTADDYHIMVVDTDATTRCTTEGCTTGLKKADELCIDPAGGYACNAQFSQCDEQMGAGVVHPAGKAASNTPCSIHGGNRYIVQGEPDLNGTFSCMAKVGLAGAQQERPMNAMVAALSPGMNAGGCNDGFVRDDAILVITFISDDPWYEDSGTPQDWYNAVVAAKGGNPNAVVMLGLTPNFPGCLDGKGPPKGAHWSELIAKFGPHGLEDSVCGADYASFFTSAISVIDDTCNSFEPPPK